MLSIDPNVSEEQQQKTDATLLKTVVIAIFCLSLLHLFGG